jgi:NitT/TauT family transport system substrate-binding protein
MRLTAAGMSRPAWTQHVLTRAWLTQPPANRRAPARRSPERAARRFRRGTAALAGLGALALAAGCSAGNGGGGGQAGGTITVAAVPGVDNVPLFMAQHGGQFSAAGVTVEIKKFSSATAEVRALLKGQVDMAAGDYGPFLYAESRQKASAPQIRIVADGYDASAGVLDVLALPGSGITKPADLGGKKIAAPSEAALLDAKGQIATAVGGSDSLDTAATTSVLRSYGVNMATVTWEPMAQRAEIAALKDGQVDAILVNEPFIYQAQARLGAIEVLDACSGATAGLPLSGYFAMSTWSSSHATAVADFKSALDHAQANSAMAGPVQNNLPGYTGMTRLEAELVTVGSYPATTNVDEVQRVATLMFGQGLLSNPVAVGKEIIH